MTPADPARVAELLARFDALPADHWERVEVLDELQDAVGLAGRMVTDADILTRARRTTCDQ